jgi:hypothetical protein
MPPSNAERIAEAVADLRAGHVLHVEDRYTGNAKALAGARTPQPVVDITAIDRSLGEAPDYHPYEDFPHRVSPWPDAIYARSSNHGVTLMQVHQSEKPGWEPWDTPNCVDWGRVRWATEVHIWVRAKSPSGVLLRQMLGPAFLYEHAIFEDGTPADIHWTAIASGADGNSFARSEMALAASLNFLGCSNVETAEPTRPYPVRRRMRKTRVQVQEIVVRPPGKRTRTANTGRQTDTLDTPLASVRGHFAQYGPQYGNGLLFGKYAGRFWRPARAVGTPRNYTLRPDTTG